MMIDDWWLTFFQAFENQINCFLGLKKKHRKYEKKKIAFSSKDVIYGRLDLSGTKQRETFRFLSKLYEMNIQSNFKIV